MKKLVIAIAAALTAASIQPALADDIYHVDLSDAFVAEVENIFHYNSDGTPFDLDLVSDLNPNIHLYQEAVVHVTFIHEKAWYKNQFGYFTYEDADGNGSIEADEILTEEILFSNVSENDGTVETGDSADTPLFPAGTNLGFFIIADGFQKPKGTYYSLPELNADGINRFPMVATSDGTNVAIGIEDKPWNNSDKDFNDVIFTFTTSPEDAIIEIIEDSDIPVNEEPEVPSEEPCDDEGETEEPTDNPETPTDDGEEETPTDDQDDEEEQTPPEDDGEEEAPADDQDGEEEVPAEEGEDDAVESDVTEIVDAMHPGDKGPSFQTTPVGPPLLFEGAGCQINPAATGNGMGALLALFGALPALNLFRSRRK